MSGHLRDLSLKSHCGFQPFCAISAIFCPPSLRYLFLPFYRVLVPEISSEPYRTYFRYFNRYSVGYLWDISWDICEIFYAFMDGKADVSLISLIWSLSQVVYSMIPALDILGIWVLGFNMLLVYFRIDRTVYHLFNPNSCVV